MQKKLDYCIQKVDSLEKKVDRMMEESHPNIKRESEQPRASDGVKMVLKLKNQSFVLPQRKPQFERHKDTATLEDKKFVQRSFKKQARSLQALQPCLFAQQLDTEPMEARTPATIQKLSGSSCEQRHSHASVAKLNCRLQLKINKKSRRAGAGAQTVASSKHSFCEDRLTCKDSPARSSENKITM
jgi:hypothetical protein